MIKGYVEFSILNFKGPLSSDFIFGFTFDYLSKSITNPYLYPDIVNSSKEIIFNQTYYLYFEAKLADYCKENEIFDQIKY